MIDEKYDLLRHPNIKWTTDGGAAPYEHGAVTRAAATIKIEWEVHNDEQ